MHLKNEKIEIPCPGGGREIKTTYGDLSRKSSLKSSKGHEYKFKSSDQSKLKRAMDKIEKLQKNFERELVQALPAGVKKSRANARKFIYQID